MKQKRKKDPDAVAMANKRAASLSPERRREIALKAINARWNKGKDASLAEEAKSAPPPKVSRKCHVPSERQQLRWTIKDTLVMLRGKLAGQVQTKLTPAVLEAVDSYVSLTGSATRGEAVAKLVRLGLRAERSKREAARVAETPKPGQPCLDFD